MGTGLVGGFIAGHLAIAGCQVRCVGRQPKALWQSATTLRLSHLDGRRLAVPTGLLAYQAGLGDTLGTDHAGAPWLPDLTLLCVKTGQTAEAAQALATVLPAGSVVLSLQNGIGQAAKAQAAAPSLRFIAGMVPFNVAQPEADRLHRGTGGAVMAADDPALRPLQPWWKASGLPLRLVPDMAPVQWGKLLLNLNNPVNALSGLPLRAELLTPRHRRRFASLVAEGYGVMRAAGLTPAQLTPLPWWALPWMLRLPTPLFRRAAAQLLKIDAEARSSMAEDLAAGRRTEIDDLCGAIVALAEAHGRRAPRNAAVVAEVHARERAAGLRG